MYRMETRIYRHLHGWHVRPHLLHRKRPEGGSSKGRRTCGGSLVQDLTKGKKDFSIPASFFCIEVNRSLRGARDVNLVVKDRGTDLWNWP